MALSGRLDPQVTRKVCAGGLSVVIHVALLIVILSGGRNDGIHSGDAPTSKLLLIEARQADRRDGVDLPPIEPTLAKTSSEDLIDSVLAMFAPPPSAPIEETPIEPALTSEPPTEAEPVAITVTEVPSTVAMSDVEKAKLTKRLEELAEQVDAARTEVTWEQDGKQYSAVLIRERANDGTSLDRVTAQVSSSDRGRHLTTLVNLNRLAFSQFTQMIDRWDPRVQLHDDEIAGRFHTNSRFNLMYDSHTAPKFFGKVTTSARSYNTEANSRRRESDIVRGGVETGADRITLPETLQPFEWAPREEGARIHEFATDTRLRFFSDGSYMWRSRETDEAGYRNDPSDRPVYFLAARDAALYVQGVVAGKFLVYSPHRIVIEGSLTYARDPREQPESPDYLGLVSDRYVEVAPPIATGPGDVEIDGAIFAGRRFVVTAIDHPRTATLRIYGSLAAGTISATEPRYATKIDYDPRFERQRPPGFPSTNRYEVADWNGQWTELPERTAED